jgi:hypothetical protein
MRALFRVRHDGVDVECFGRGAGDDACPGGSG